jgi:Tol biopolymer transport system component
MEIMKSTTSLLRKAKTIGVICLSIVLVLATGACSSGTDAIARLATTATPAPTAMPTPTPKPAPAGPPAISGVPVLPDIEVEAGDLLQVTLYDLAWSEIASDKDRNPEYHFTVDRGSNYILVADYRNGPSLAAITPSVTGAVTQNITIDSEVAMDLVIATEQAFDDLLPGSLSRPLDDLLVDADRVVANLNAFHLDRNTNREADRVADAVRAFVMDRLNGSSFVYASELNEDILRAYGGGLQGIRSLDEMVSDPLPPLNPHFVFTRHNYNNQVDFGMSDLETKRWDFMGARGMTPHIVTGGDSVVYTGPTSTRIASISEYVLGLYVRDLGTHPDDARLITPSNLDCWTPSWSPDQSKIAFTGRYVYNPSSTRSPAWYPLNLFVIDARTREITQLTHDRELVFERIEGSLNPSWSPDGKTIIFDNTVWSLGPASEYARLEMVETDSPYTRSVFLGHGESGIWEPFGPKYSPDGTRIVFSAYVDGGNQDADTEVLVAPADYGVNGGSIFMLTDDGYDDSTPDWSFDGRFIMFSSNRDGEPSRVSPSGYLRPFYVISAYTGELVSDLGDFANAGTYYGARFCATEAVMAAVAGTAKNSTGEAVISGSDYRKSSTGNSDYNYYRETIPAANNIVDAYGSPAYNYGVTSWW